ncbi:hypothetical protein DFAR_3180026 [Desulfarculales bacterium]
MTPNSVPVYAGWVAAGLYLGCTAVPDEALRDGRVSRPVFKYGGAHIIEDLVSSRKVKLMAQAYGTDCYPSKE